MRNPAVAADNPNVITLDFGLDAMLAEIGAAGASALPWLADPADPRFEALDAVGLVVRGVSPQSIVPPLHAALRRRYAAVDPERLDEDLLGPVKKSIGNAERRGNLSDPSKHITVRVTATRAGAVVAVHDEGAGFDVATVYAKFRSPGDEKYFTRKGQGFEKFEKTTSRVSWADGGSTFLLRFLAAPPPGREPLPEAVAADPALDAGAMRPRLAAAIGATIERCTVFVPDDRKNEAWDVKYRLENGTAGAARLLTARRLDAAAARRDFEHTRVLSRAAAPGAARVPAPVALVADPSLVLFDFDPSVDLRDACKQDPPPAERDARLAAIGRGLALVHGSTLDPGATEDSASFAARLAAVAARATVAARPHDAAGADRIGAFGAALAVRATRVGAVAPAVVHGDFGWHRVLRGSEGGWYLVGFEHARRAHPGLDVGAFLADVERHGAREDEDEAPRDVAAWRAAFLDAYSGGRPLEWRADLPFFTAAGLLFRLDRLVQRPPKRWVPKLAGLLALCEASLAAD